DITVENNIFSYPGYSKRMLRDQSKTSVTEFIGACKNLKIINNIFQYTEGEAFHLEGSNHLIENNLLRHIDFSCVNLYMIGGTVNFKGENNIFRNNTIYVAGASETVTPGSNNTVEGNDIRSIGFLQNDGSMIQYMTAPAVGSVTRYNWLHDCLKSGMRFDGSLDVGNTGQPGLWTPWGAQTKGQVYKNTIWNTPTGLMIKGDYHVVVNNTVFENEKVGIVMINPPPMGANSNSICKNNVASMISGYRGGRTPNEYPIPGDHSHNWNGYFETGDVPTVVQDIANRDFRPKKNKDLINFGTSDFNSDDLFPEHLPIDTLYDIGAYEYGDSIYNIPGRRLEKCSHPIPFNKGTSNSDDVILAWRPVYKTTSYKVFVGSSEDAVKNATTSSAEYKGEFSGNVFHPGEMNAHDIIYWRVDAIKVSGIEKGDVWSFTAGVDANKVANTSTPNFMNEGTITLYPNPVKNILRVNSAVNEKLTYKLVNINGEVIRNGELPNSIQNISVSNLKPGTYFFRIIESGDVFKLVKL
ncbi:MAG: T9SS type A sorting domain-containing protein, partial [Prolixibacteraceae bacterium]|nr:T9SS type A sorting domain-containing protein [Prolixibacteraceae bacterium]